MGWFSIAVVIGFLLFWSWRGGKGVSAWIWWLVGILFIDFLPVTLIMLMAVWALLFFLGPYSVRIDEFNADFVEQIRLGYVTRFILGLILGFGTGYVLEQRSRAADETKPSFSPADGDIIAQRHTESTDEPTSALSSLARLSTNTLLTIGIGMFVLALASPHLDSWLNHLTRIKLPYGELTVATTTTHRTVNSDALLYLADALSLVQLSNYNEKLNRDIEYIRTFQIPQMTTDQKIQEMDGYIEPAGAKKLEKMRNALKNAEKLKPVFDRLISPIAYCLVKAIDNGMSAESIRQKLRPAAKNLEEIIFVGDRLNEQTETEHQEFWETVKGLPEFIKNYLPDENTKDAKTSDKDTEYIKECRSYLKSNEGLVPADIKKLRETSNLPRMKDYKDVPYLGVAAFFFSAFVKDEELAQQIFEKMAADLQYKDKEFLYFESYIGYYKGLPTETFIPYLEQLLKEAREHKGVLQRADKQCTVNSCEPTRKGLIDRLLKREEDAEIRAINDLAYYIGDSIARGVPAAMNYKGRAEDYINELYRFLDKEDDLGIRNELLDTYAYVSIVLESRKAAPDPDTFRRMLAILEKVAEYLEDKAPKTFKLEDATDRANLVLVRAHLAAARQLADD